MSEKPTYEELEQRIKELKQEADSHKLVEEALRESEKLLSMAGHTVRFGGWSAHLDGHEVVWSEQVALIHEKQPGYSPTVEEAIQYYAPEWRDKIAAAFQICIREGTPYDEEMEIITTGGHRLWVRTTGEAVRDNMGKIVRVQGSFQDINERKRAEQALKNNQNFLNRIINQSPFATWISDEKGTMIKCNAALKKFLNITDEQLIGKYNVFEDEVAIEQGLIPKIRTVFEDGKTANFSVEWDADELGYKDAKKVHIEGTMFPIHDDKGDLTNVVNHWIDITERKKAEEQIKVSLKEKEILLREIHHRVKNNMQVITSLLSLQSDTIKDQEYADMFRESQERIRSMALIHETLYQSEDFANIDFDGYLWALINNLFISYGINPEIISMKIKTNDLSLALDYAIPCGLIINELVSNCLKHAFPDEREGEIQIVLQEISENEIELTVSDNGMGIPEEFDFGTTESLGLDLVKVLAEHQLGGRIEMNGTGGTRFSIRFMVKAEKARI